MQLSVSTALQAILADRAYKVLELKTFSGATFVGTNIQIKFNEILLTKCVYCNDEFFSTIQNISEVRILFFSENKRTGDLSPGLFICIVYKQYYNHRCKSSRRGSAPIYFYCLCKPIQGLYIWCRVSGRQCCFSRHDSNNAFFRPKSNP